MPLSLFFRALFFISLCGLASGHFTRPVAAAETARVEFQIIPELRDIRPLEDRASMILTFKDAAGRALQNARAQIELEAPPAGRLLSTDFPAVEGSRLVEMELSTPDGEIRWDYVFPIRGEYRLRVRTLGPREPSAERTFTFRVGENPRRLLYLAIFAVGLFSLGFWGGRIVMVAVLLLLCATPKAGESATPTAVKTTELKSSVTVEPATTQRPTRVFWNLVREDSGDPIPALLSLSIEALEKEKTIFSLETPTDGRFALRFHFADGSPHRVKAVATVEGRASSTDQTISVMAEDPPLGLRLRTWFYAILIMIAGWVAGRVSRGDRRKS